MAYDAHVLRVSNIQWLGVFPSEAEKYSIPSQCLLPLTKEGGYYLSDNQILCLPFQKTSGFSDSCGKLLFYSCNN